MAIPATFVRCEAPASGKSTRHDLCNLHNMRDVGSFRDLKVWRDAMALVEEIYRATKMFPPDERFGLTSQLRRAAVSVPSNIGEGKRRKRNKAFAHHLDIALGSQGELEVQLEIAKRVGFLNDMDYVRLQRQIEAVGRMLNGLRSSIQPFVGGVSTVR